MYVGICFLTFFHCKEVCTVKKYPKSMPSYTIHHPSLNKCHTSPIIHHPSSGIQHPSSIIHLPSTIICHPSSIIYHQSFIIRHLIDCLPLEHGWISQTSLISNYDQRQKQQLQSNKHSCRGLPFENGLTTLTYVLIFKI